MNERVDNNQLMPLATTINTESPTPRYGPLPTINRNATNHLRQQMAPIITGGSVPMNRRLRGTIPPPAYSDLDDFDTNSGTEQILEPRYQPMPLSHCFNRRPLPNQPNTLLDRNHHESSNNNNNNNNSINTNRSNENNNNKHQKPATVNVHSSHENLSNMTKQQRRTSYSSESALEGDYEDISQL